MSTVAQSLYSLLILSSAISHRPPPPPLRPADCLHVVVLCCAGKQYHLIVACKRRSPRRRTSRSVLTGARPLRNARTQQHPTSRVLIRWTRRDEYHGATTAGRSVGRRGGTACRRLPLSRRHITRRYDPRRHIHTHIYIYIYTYP